MIFTQKHDSKNEDNPWESISDLMTGLMIVFLFVGIAFMAEYVQAEQRMGQEKAEINNSIKEILPNDKLAKWGATYDPETQVISFVNSDVFFEAGSSTVTPEYKQILDEFVPELRKALKDEKIAEIRIEGNTSPEWGADTDVYSAYLKNMKLSEERSLNVLLYCFTIPGIDTDTKDWLKNKVRATGMADSQHGKSAKQNQARRVDFRIIPAHSANVFTIKDALGGKK